MYMTKVAMFFLAFAWTGCTTSPPSYTASTTASPATPTSSPEQIAIQAKEIVTTFAENVESTRDKTLGPIPSIEIKNTPQQISYQYESNSITVPTWAEQPEPVKEIFRIFSSGNDDETKIFFELFFNRFLVAHEASHWFQHKTWKGPPPDLYALEKDANELAVAFWRTQPDGEELLKNLEQLAVNAYEALPDPTPPGQDPSIYFGKNYEQLGADPIKYGYYQFKFMADALRKRSQLDFNRMASRPYSGNEVIAK